MGNGLPQSRPFFCGRLSGSLKKSQADTLRQQAAVGRVVQKAAQHTRQIGVGSSIGNRAEIIGNHLCLLLHIELRQIVAYGKQVAVGIGTVADITALQRKADAAQPHGKTQPLLPNVYAFVHKQMPQCTPCLGKIAAVERGGIERTAVGRHGGVGILQR